MMRTSLRLVFRDADGERINVTQAQILPEIMRDNGVVGWMNMLVNDYGHLFAVRPVTPVSAEISYRSKIMIDEA